MKLVAKDDSISDLAALKQPAAAKWTEKIETEFVAAPNDAPYVIDTFKLPFDNPYKSLLFTSGHDFFSNGDIAVCTVHGDVWVVRRDGEKKLQWRRFATGLHQPLGLVIVRRDSPDSDAIYVLGRDQITRLHDTNNDGETDYYECFSNVYPTSAGGHDYITCLERDSLGNFWFVHANLGIVRVSADGSKFDVISTGLRNPNGMGLGPGDVVTAAPQEGDWTPASAIFVAKPGAHFGGGGPRVTPERPLGFDPPAVWIPRRVDNSSGGQCWVTSDKWGPLSGHMLHFSFGQCSAMLGIGSHARHSVEGSDTNPAHIPPRSGERGYIPVGLTEFPFRFDSGAMRGRFSPHDGQLYVTGLRGWTTSAVTDGCLQRVRFTGQPIDMPVSSTAYSNGIALTFTEPLDKDSAENPSNYHIEQWNYLYSKTYGSPEYRVSDPKQEGRDEVRVRSATLLDDRTVFLELKQVQPVNVLAVSCVLKGRSEAKPAPLATSPLPREFRRTIYLTLNFVRPEKFDESRLNRRSVTDDALEASLRPGLMARFAAVESAGRMDGDVRVDRMAATFVSPIHAPSQFLKPGPFVARWEGFLKVPLQQIVTFRIEGTGDAKLVVNDKNIALGKTTLLNGGFNKLAIEYASPTDGRVAQVRLMWESNEFAREPVPPTVLFHNSENEKLIQFQQLRQGRELFASLRCVACHGANDDSPLAPELIHDAPNLAGIGRLNQQWAIDWIVDPNKEHPGTRMPHLNVTPAEAADIAMWLGTKAANVEPSSKGGNAAEGSVAFEELGCLVCHRLKGDEVDEYSRRSLAHVKDKFATGQLAAFLKEPQRFHPTSHMPDFRLDEATATSLSAFLLQQTSSPNRTLRHPVSAENGAKLFVDRGCVQCHAVGDQAARPRTELALLVDVASSQGCLADRPHQRAGVPHYPLTLADRTALLRFLKTDLRSLQQSVPAEAARSLTKGLRCHACHDRDGAISPRRAIIADESDRGRITDVYPNLTWTGEKLQADWMTHFIGGNQTGKSADPPNPLRPWLKGRMPKFPAYAAALAAGMAAEHGVNLAAEALPSPDPQRAELGNLLTQRTALDCRQCHAVGNQPAQGDDKTKIAPGINFALVKERLRYDYYQRFTLDPPRFDINTKMPKLATDGKSTKVTTILEGDARQQFDAIWHFIGTAQLATD